MKTDYQPEIQNFILKHFEASSSDNEKAVPKTLEEIKEMVINVLPAKWIYDSDVYNALQILNFTPSFGKKEEIEGLYYYLKIK